MHPGPVDVNDISNIHVELWRKLTIRNSAVFPLTRPTEPDGNDIPGYDDGGPWVAQEESGSRAWQVGMHCEIPPR